MGNGIQFYEIIILAAVAGFLILRLRGVLGRRTGHQEPPSFDFKKDREEESDDTVVQLPDRDKKGDREGQDAEAAMAEADTPLAAGLTQIKLADRGFDESEFENGAKVAFEMVVNAFAQGDTRTLRPLLSNDVYDDFAGAIKSRQDAKETLETTLVGISSAEVIEAELQGKTAFVTIKFVSEQINVTRNAEGETVDGDASHVTTITDIWTFARNTRSRDPNWTLVATRSQN